MDYLMLVLLACSDGSLDCEPEALFRPSTLIECTEQDRMLSSGYALLTEWAGETRQIIVSSCIPMDDARAMGLITGGAGS